MAERSRIFTGTLPDGQPVMVTVFEQTSVGQDTGRVRWNIDAVQVALKEGEDRFARWAPQTDLTEEKQ